MLMLVLGDNFLVMFVGWEGVGPLLVPAHRLLVQEEERADAGKKAFIVNRIGDWGFVLGMFLVFYTFGTLDFRAVADAALGDAGRDAGVRRAVADLPARCSSAPPARARRFRCTSGCRTRWKARPRYRR